MLSEFIQAIINRLSGLGAPVYQADCVPEGTACPYITMNIAAPLGDTAGALTLTIWHSSNMGRIGLAQRLASLLPAHGLPMALTLGNAVITGGTASFLQEAPLLGVRMVWKLRFYPIG